MIPLPQTLDDAHEAPDSLLSGRASCSAPRFGGQSASSGGMLSLVRDILPPPNAVQQFVQDTVGVWVPKAPVSWYRSKLQFFEDTFLELVEDGAFYFTIPIMGRLLSRLINRKEAFTKDYRDIGTSWTELAGRLKQQPHLEKSLVAAKSGAVVGALGSALLFEFMIQHMKNVVTARVFKTANFTGVAGLEDSRTDLKDNEIDPVAKAAKRGKQVAVLLAGILGTSLALPHLIRKNDAVLRGAKKVLSYLNFDSAKTKGAFFDTQKSFLALLTFVGLAGYLDAARDRLEWKEQLTRLAVVIPYLLFGKQLVSQGLARLVEKVPVGVGSARKALGQHVSLIRGSALAQARKPETFLNLDVTKSAEAVAEELAQHKNIPAETAKAINRWTYWGVHKASYVIAAAIAGVGINLVSYAMTRKRYDLQEQKHRQANLRNNVKAPAGALKVQQNIPSAASSSIRPNTVSPAPQPALYGTWPSASWGAAPNENRHYPGLPALGSAAALNGPVWR